MHSNYRTPVASKSKQSNPESLSALDLVLCISAGIIMTKSFGNSYLMTANQMAPIIRLMPKIDDNFLPRDWYTHLTTDPHLAFSFFYATIGRFVPLQYATIASHYFFNVILFVGIMMIFLNRFRHPRHVFMMLAITISSIPHTFLFSDSIGTTSLVYWELAPISIAGSLLILGIGLLLRRNFVAAGIALGASGLFHFSLMFLCLLSASVILMSQSPRPKLRELVKFTFAPLVFWIILSACIYTLLFIDGLHDPSGYSHLVFRAPGHREIFSWPLLPSILWLLPVISGLLILILSNQRTSGDAPADNLVYAMILVVFAVLAVYLVSDYVFLGSAIRHIKPLYASWIVWLLCFGIIFDAMLEEINANKYAKKNVIPVFFISVIFIFYSFRPTSARDEVELLSIVKRSGVILLPIILFPVILLILSRSNRLAKSIYTKPFVCTSMLLSYFISAYVLVWWVGPHITETRYAVSFSLFYAPCLFVVMKHVASEYSKAPIVKLLCMKKLYFFLLVGVLIALFSRAQDFHVVNDKSKPESIHEDEMLCWIISNTNKDDVFLTPPYVGRFRTVYRRPIVVDFGLPPAFGKELNEWYRRLVIVTGHDEKYVLKPANSMYFTPQDSSRFLRSYDGICYNHVKLLSLEFDVSYFVTKTQDHNGDVSALTLVFQNDLYTIYKIEN